MAAITSATSPPCPFVISRTPAVVPCTVGQHELHVRSQSSDHLVQNLLIVCGQCIERQRGQRLLDVVTQIDGTTLLGTDELEWVPFSKQQTVGSEIFEAGVSKLVSTVEVV